MSSPSVGWQLTELRNWLSVHLLTSLMVVYSSQQFRCLGHITVNNIHCRGSIRSACILCSDEIIFLCLVYLKRKPLRRNVEIRIRTFRSTVNLKYRKICHNIIKKFRGFSPPANNTDRATAASRRS
jgi:hypothetical protein